VQGSVNPSAFPVSASTPASGTSQVPSPAQAGQAATAKTARAKAPKLTLPTSQQFATLEGSAKAPVVAVQDGRVVALGRSTQLGHYVVLEDAYGDFFTYAGLGSVATRYRLPDTHLPANTAPTAAAAASQTAAGPTPSQAASAGSQQPQTLQAKASASSKPVAPPAPEPEEEATSATAGPGKVLMFAHPGNPDARIAAARFRRPAPKPAYPKGWGPLQVGSVVSQGVTLGTSTASANGTTGSLRFAIRPAGDSAAVDPRPLLQNWEQLQHALHPQGAKGSSGLVGATASDVFLLTKEELERAALADPGIELPSCARHEVITGRVDSRVLALLLFLSRNGLTPSVSAIRCAPASSAPQTRSPLAQGEGVDISKISGVPIAEHQGAGTITDLTIRTLLTLQGRFAPHSIVSLMRYPGAPTTDAKPDHASYVGIDFLPEKPTLAGQAATAAAAHSAGAGATAPSPFAVSLGLGAAGSSSRPSLSTSQWNQLLSRIGALQQPTVPTKPSASAIQDQQASAGKPSQGSHH
jgi:hypothetical protein